MSPGLHRPDGPDNDPAPPRTGSAIACAIMLHRRWIAGAVSFVCCCLALLFIFLGDAAVAAIFGFNTGMWLRDFIRGEHP